VFDGGISPVEHGEPAKRDETVNCYLTPRAGEEWSKARAARIQILFGGPYRMTPLLFVQVFAGNVVLGHLTGANFFSFACSGILNARNYPSLEGVAFFNQLVDAF